MRVSASSSFLIATLASSTSIASLAAAAPTEDRRAVTPVGIPGAPDLGGVIGSFEGGAPAIPGLPRDDLEVRQVGGLVDTVAGLLPVVDTILSLLGLKRASTIGAQDIPILPQDQVDAIKAAILQLSGGILPTIPGAPNGSTDTSGNQRRQIPNLPNVGDLPTGIPDFVSPFNFDAAPSSTETGSCSGPTGVSAAGLPAPPSLPGGIAPGSSLPIPSPPVSLPVPGGAPAPPGSNAPNGTAPGSPAPAPPVALPVSPSLPPNPPNSPAAPGVTPPAPLPPLFAAAGFNYTSSNGTDPYPQYPNTTETSSAPGASETA